MQRLSLRLAVALSTFIIGVAIASLWFIGRNSSQAPIITEVSYVPPAQPKPVSVTQDRDLSHYDHGGRQGCGLTLISEASRCAASMKKARAFIWKHWQEKRHGYIIVKFATDDAESDAHIFIEPDESGAWHVVWRWERVFGIQVESGRIDDVPDIRAIERRRATDRDYRYESGTSYLSFLGVDGEEVQYL